MSWINENNITPIVGILWSMTTVYILRDVYKNWHLWRKGASVRGKEVMDLTVHQLEKCNDELDRTQNERDVWRRKVGARDYVILSNGLKVPDNDE